MSSAQCLSDMDNYNAVLAELEYLRRERVSADEALERAQRSVHDIAARERQLQGQLKAYDDCITASRLQRIQQFLKTFPEDLLRCVFEAVADLPDDNWQAVGYGSYNAVRSAAPFTLAAVCSRWRRVALHCPRLWGYVSLPDPESGEFLDAHASRIDLLIARSSPCPLDILIGQPWGNCVATAEVHLRYCVEKLSWCSSRWRRVELYLPYGFEALLDVLRGPLPLVSHLAIGTISLMSTDEEGEPPDDYLPFVPCLNELDISAGVRICRLPGPPRFPSLRSLAIWDIWSTECVLELLSMCQQTLERLVLIADGDTQQNYDIPLSFPCLRSLVLRNETFFAHLPAEQLIFKNLTTLALGEEAISHDLVPLLLQVAPTVTNLTLQGAFAAASAAAAYVLEQLVNVSHLEIARFTPSEPYFVFPDELFAVLADTEPCIWPKLASLRIGAGVTLGLGRGNGLLRLLRKRRWPPSSPEYERVLRIAQVDCADFAPRWLSDEVARVLAE
ncbi:hypothetical protein AURDEDRAFT_153031 [Auricularia subglabra TFB-10046 SS5]|nr:hypothetical protein AURDEDRAFT_153031 [Auricularia subglabra TFB-10046 SS5]